MDGGGQSTDHGAATSVDRFLTSGDESGTAPEDRPFRPDVEGLRAVAVLLVVFFHAGTSALSGGYVGVDVFFVISGFVITGVLLRERTATGGTSVLVFYGRRCRRILPAATLVIVATVAITYFLLGVVSGDQAASDGRWAAIFLANFHFIAIGTNYLTSLRAPSPLQHFWSLAVEEQFYIVYPTLFALVAGARWLWSLRARLAIVLGSVIVSSFIFSVVLTSTNPTVAYFSPLTRAWELALGALVAVGTPWLRHVPRSVDTVMTWVGLGAIVVSAVSFGSHTAYPGSLVAIPVVGAALVIAGGSTAPRFGAEAVLGLAPMQALGRLSYSLYLWHWPILILAAQWQGKASLPFRQNLVWVLVALALSAITYVLVENPVRHAKFPSRHRWASVGLGVALMSATVGLVTLELDVHSDSTASAATAPITRNATYQTVRSLVAAAPRLRTVPADLAPSLGEASSDWGIPPPASGCWPARNQPRVRSCVFGDPNAHYTVVLYGDSHASMWFQAFDEIALAAHWKLVVLGKGACPADPLPIFYGGVEWKVCAKWNSWAVHRINSLRPDLLILSQMYPPDLSTNYTPAQWQRGLEARLRSVTAPKAVKIVLGDIPLTDGGPDCLAQHVTNVQACSSPPQSILSPYDRAERAAATAAGARFIDVTPWFCSSVCTSIIGRYEVYWDAWHVTKTYSRFLEGVLAQAVHTAATGT